ncbi:S-layer homology domain-containing protein [Bifidobacterium myosotis]|uniref:S-layer homology domain-containing protein n=1 Tax=Bifidobacterium myosotis TaxID=1630166 RepID=UPI001177CE26|nr:S-layer homology domain-containing protein [Bifidobacterium myosotis]
MTFDWSITGTTTDQIKSVCFVVPVVRTTSITPIENRKLPYAFGGPSPYNCSNGLDDSDLTDMSPQDAQAAYDKVYGVHDDDLTLPDENGGQYVAAKISGQSYYRYYSKSWDGKSLSGTFSAPVIGLLPNSTYGNSSSDALSTFEQLWDQGVRQTTPVDIRSMSVGLQVELKNGSFIYFGMGSSQVPDFTTTAEPAGPTDDKLTSDTKDKIHSDNAGKVEAGKSARIYINDLKESCKVDDASCFWYGYIYSEPTRLVSAKSGGPELPIQKDDAGKYYVDAFIPDGFSGEHKIALTDETGTLQGWTDVTVDRGQTSPFTDVIKGKTPHFDEILWLADQGISTGWKQPDGTTTFAPEADVNRQDMAAFLYRLAGSPEFDETKAKNPFADVTEKTPHYKEILWLASTGITTGYTQADGTVRFEGLAGVQRQDMAAFLHRLADYTKAPAPTGEGKSFTDVDEKTPHAEDIAWLAKTGVTTGYEDGTFGGSRIVIRQDMAAFLQRMKTNVLK